MWMGPRIESDDSENSPDVAASSPIPQPDAAESGKVAYWASVWGPLHSLRLHKMNHCRTVTSLWLCSDLTGTATTLLVAHDHA